MVHLTYAQLVKKFPAFMEPQVRYHVHKSPLPYPYAEPDEFFRSCPGICPRPCVTFRTTPVSRWLQVLSLPSNLQGGRPPIVGCPGQLIQHTCCYPLHLEAVASIRNLRTHRKKCNSNVIRQ